MKDVYEPVLGTAKKTPLAGGGAEFRFGIATLSLIDPKLVTLPLVDRVEPGEKITRQYICGNKYYRFANFLDAKITVDSHGKIIEDGLTKISGLYRDNSFLGHDSQAFKTRQYDGQQPIKPQVSAVQITADHTVNIKTPGIQGRRYVQTVGARTKTSDDVGRMTDTTHITNELSLPPIWSTLRLSIYANGTTKAELLYHSLFPSVWFFVQDSNNSDQFNFIGRYEGDNTRLISWYNGGFGPVTVLQVGANRGNPWRMPNPHVITR